jgi:prephenate dehydrogenase
MSGQSRAPTAATGMSGDRRAAVADVLVVGCGLIGASVGLALRDAGRDVVLHDDLPSHVGEAVRRGAGRPWESGERARVVLVAVPPSQTARVLSELQSRNLAQTYTHVASVQSHVQAEIEALNCDLSQIVGGHPLAGRERSGPGAATADLFVGRPWALCASPLSGQQSQQDVRALISDCGADVVEMSAQEHDAAVALLSHLPQIVASALAGSLLSVDATDDQERPLQLAGPGLVDTTRLAASDAELWSQILTLNAAHLAPLVGDLARRLHAVAQALTALGGPSAPAEAAAALVDVRTLLRTGNAGRALVPVKRGVRAEAFAPVRISVRDEPGRLATLLQDAGNDGFNVEDVHVEHIPGRPTGVIELLVRTEDVAAVAAALAGRGWTVLDG